MSIKCHPCGDQLPGAALPSEPEKGLIDARGGGNHPRRLQDWCRQKKLDSLGYGGFATAESEESVEVRARCPRPRRRGDVRARGVRKWHLRRKSDPRANRAGKDQPASGPFSGIPGRRISRDCQPSPRNDAEKVTDRQIVLARIFDRAVIPDRAEVKRRIHEQVGGVHFRRLSQDVFPRIAKFHTLRFTEFAEQPNEPRIERVAAGIVCVIVRRKRPSKNGRVWKSPNSSRGLI